MNFSPFTFVQISDSHARAGGAESHSRVNQTLAAIQARKPSLEFILHTGDLVDDPSEESVKEFRAIFANCKMPMHVVPGNHEVWNGIVKGEGAPWWTRATTSADEQQFRAWFGPTAYSFICHDCAFVGFNSQLLNNTIPEANEQWEWLTMELARLDALQLAHIILFTHMPLFVRSPEEQLDWTDWRNSYMVIGPPGRERLLELIRKYRVSGYLNGHLHYPLQHTIRWDEGGASSFVTCDACGPTSAMAQQQFNLPPLSSSGGFCLHRVEREGIVTEFVI